MEDAWSRLFKFPCRCLARPSRGGQCHSLATAVNRQLQEEADKPVPQLGRQRGLWVTDDPLSDVRKRVSPKLEEDFRGAVHIACSEDSITDINSVDIIRALSEKHPPRYDDSCVPQRSELFSSSSSSLNFSNAEVLRAIHSIPRGSAGGTDGLRPQHLLDLTSASAESGGVVLLSAFASFTSHVANGNTSNFIQPYFWVPV